MILNFKMSLDKLFKFLMFFRSKSISWLNRLATGRFSNTIETVFAVACSLLLTSNDRRLLDLSLSQMLRITKENARLSSSGMSVVFFKMANLSTCEPQQSTPECIYSLMKALPNFANDKWVFFCLMNKEKLSRKRRRKINVSPFFFFILGVA